MCVWLWPPQIPTLLLGRRHTSPTNPSGPCCALSREHMHSGGGFLSGTLLKHCKIAGRGGWGVWRPSTPSLGIARGESQNHVSQKLVQRGLQGRAEVPRVVPGEGHEQAVAQELRRKGGIPIRGPSVPPHPSLVRTPPYPGKQVQLQARVLTLKLTGSTFSLCTCRSLRADRTWGKSSRWSTARVSASATFWPWALTWAEPGLRSRWRK